jgi:hypothetical protein
MLDVADHDRDTVLGLVALIKEGTWDRTPPPDDVLDALIDAWGNYDWPVQRDYLRAIGSSALEGQKAILECGSGLSTLVLGALTNGVQTPVHSLESDPAWFELVDAYLKISGLGHVDLRLAPLRSYGDFSWYEYPTDWSVTYSLVVCDGPPGDTPGGRYGVIPTAGSNLAGATVLLDDFDREGEQAVARRWAQEWGLNLRTVSGTTRSYGVGVVPK